MGSSSVITVILIMMTSSYCKRLYSKENLYIGYDFETEEDLDHVKTFKSEAVIDDRISKHKAHSLRWDWRVNEPLIIGLNTQRHVFKNKRQPCGFYFWLHQEKSVKSHLHLIFTNTENENFEFRVNLDFDKWRAVARIFAVTQRRRFNDPIRLTMFVKNEDPFHKTGSINFDLLRLSNRCIGWPYDYINTPQIPLPYGKRNEIGGIDDLNGIYEVNHFWQSMYKWRKIDEFHNNKIDGITRLSENENILTKELNKIELRIDNWYFPNDKNSENISDISKLKLKSLKHCMDMKSNFSVSFLKWLRNHDFGNFPYVRRPLYASPKTLHKICFDSAYEKLNRINKFKKWPSLFPSRDILPYGNKKEWEGMKFNEVIGRIIFPLSLEYFISRRNSQRKLSMRKASKSKEHLKNIIEEELHSKVNIEKLLGRKRNIRKIYKAIDHRKLKIIRRLLNHVQSQGWVDGSGLGNTDHLINLNSGFSHVVYLLKKNLKNVEFFQKLIKAGRWYNEIGELHQINYAHTGSTADKIRNLIINRLLIIIASPGNTPKEARQKINDAFNLKRWVENALSINEGYAGLIKPDFTGFHHKGVYMSAYIPQAYHALSLVAYFLHGTAFAIGEMYLNNLKNALNDIYVVSNMYGVPPSVSGAKPDLRLNIMDNLIPSFAYLTLALTKSTNEINPDLAKSFMKLYRPDDEHIKYSLIDGNPSNQGSQYFNTIGSITIMENLFELCQEKGIDKKSIPNGHWTFPYAGLNVHRRNNYTVTVKGFNKYIWDFESVIDQNVFGRYFSHGFLSIMNGKKSLTTSDIYHGFDWIKIPGATTVQLNLDQLKAVDKCRYFSNKTFLGGLIFGKRKARNGIFAMEFAQPSYLDKFYKDNSFDFSFKKSFIFIEDMIIALGSGINKTGLAKSDVFTTLFQNKLSKNSQVYLNGKPFNVDTETRLRWSPTESITIVDADNNGYFIPFKRNQKINLKIKKDKDARKPNGLKVKFPSTYASLAINHGSEPHNGKYEYVVLIDNGKEKVEKFKTLMTSTSYATKPYFIIRQDNVAHIVKFVKHEGRDVKYKLTTYVIFDEKRFYGDRNQHLINQVNRPCLIAVKEKGEKIHISISDPDLRMFDDYILYSKFIQENLMYKTHSKTEKLKIFFNQNIRLNNVKNENKTLENSVTPVFFERNEFGEILPTIEMLMSHGLTTEMKMRYL